MAAFMDKYEREERRQVVEILKKQIEIEGELIGQYKNYGEKIENIAIRRILHMILFDSQKHIESLWAAIDIIEGRDVLKKDRKDLKEGLKRHVELEMESIKAAEKVLKFNWVQNTKGLKALLEAWRNEEKRHHRILKQLSEKSFIVSRETFNLFKDEDFFEERYLSSKRFLESQKKE